MSHPIKDALQREQALDPTQSIICEAPAGSGKTELLTQRFLCLLARVRTPEEVLAITFTRKASGEMRERIIGALHTAKTTHLPDEAHRRVTWQLADAVLKRDDELEWDILDNPNRLQILTFDSLCAKLANTLPWHSSFAGAPGVSEDARELFSVAVRSFMQTLESDSPWSDSLARILSLLDNNTHKVEEYLMSMLSQRESWLPLLGAGQDRDYVLPELEANLQNVCIDGIEKIKGCLSPDLTHELLEVASFAASELSKLESEAPLLSCVNLDVDNAELPDASVEGLLQWQGIIWLLFSDKNEWRKSLTKKNGFPTSTNKEEKAFLQSQKKRCTELITQLGEIPGLKQYLIDARRFPSMTYDADQAGLLDAFIHVLPVLAAYLTLHFKERNSVDFPEISIRASEALGGLSSPSDLALMLDYKIQHILVDEFQDTSPAQIQLLTQLTAGWQQDDGRTMFCVGDAMQSIYGFRGANVGLFLHCIEHGLGHIPLMPIRLVTNFRSELGVVDWVNRTFSRSFPQANDITVGAVKYAHSHAFNVLNEPNAVCVHTVEENENSKHILTEPQVVLNIVQQTQQETPDARIAVLVRTRSHAKAIATLLKREGYKYRALDIETLNDNYVVQDLMALTHALLRPADRIAWLSVLRAPWCGLSLADLDSIASLGKEEDKVPAFLPTVMQQLSLLMSEADTESDCNAHTQESFSNASTQQGDLFSVDESAALSPLNILSADGQQRIKRIFPVLQEALLHIQRKDLRAFVEGAWFNLGGPACLQSQQDIQNAQLFFELLEKLDHNTILETKDALSKAVDRLFAVADPDSDEKLQIMTIHKSKGLEFDTVIIPGLQKTSRNLDPELLRWYERISLDGEQQLVMAPIKASGRDEDKVYQHLMHVQRIKEENEACRLLYVACTRARQKLHLIMQLGVKEKDNTVYKPPRKGSLAFPIWGAIEKTLHEERIKYLSENHTPLDEAEVNVTEPEIQEVPEDELPNNLYRLNSHWQLPVLPQEDILDEYILFHDHDNQQTIEVDWQDPVPRIIGTVVHRVLQRCNARMLSHLRDRSLVSVLPAWRSQLIALGVAADQLDDALYKTQTSIKRIVNDERFHWLFADNYPLREAEFEISLVDNDADSKIRHFMIDLLLCDGDTTWVIDYKTSEPEEGEALLHFKEGERKRYRQVMQQYRTAVEKLGFKNVKTALYFPMISEWLEFE